MMYVTRSMPAIVTNIPQPNKVASAILVGMGSVDLKSIGIGSQMM